MHVVYILQHDITKNIYIGQTSNLKQRLESHNSNKNKSTSRRNGCWVLIYAEVYRNKSDALTRESKLKHHGSSKHELLKIIKICLIETNSEAG